MILEALTSAVAQQVVNAIANEAHFAINFRSELEQMREGLQGLNAVLVDADQKLKLNDHETIKIQLSRLRALIYEADNALVDCLVRDGSRKNSFFSCLLLQNPLFPHGMGKNLTNINVQMKDVQDMLVKYLSASAGRDRIPASDADHGATDSMRQHSSMRGFIASQDFCSHKTYGLEEDIEKLKGWILDKREKTNSANYVSIVGMGGLGKTTIAQRLFNDTQVISHFNKMMWVCVSQNFSEERVVKKILERAGETSPYDKSDSNGMLGRLIRILQGQAYLIVLDDVWPNETNQYWLKNLCSQLPTTAAKTSCIITTTRNEEVAEIMVLNSTQIHHPKRLNQDDSWSLLSEYAFRSHNGICPSEKLKVEAEPILKKCGGLPLAIKNVGSVLSTKGNAPSKWKETSDRFHALTTEKKTEDIMLSLRLSYDELPITVLKQCLLCVSIYPEDIEIHAEQLIYWWVGEGLIHGTGSKTPVELGYEYLAELVNRCLVEAVEKRGYDGRVYKCKIHDMVRELIINLAAEEEFCSFNDQGRLEQKENSRWLCFTDDMDDKTLRENSKLRTFFLMSRPPIDFSKNIVLLESLRVLDLSYSKFEKVFEDDTTHSPVISAEDLFNCISSLKRLACLNLSGVQKLIEVPPSIQKLLNLQLLVLNECNKLVRIHPYITRLKRLIVLHLESCPLEYLPQGLGELSHLQELSGFRVLGQAKPQGCAFNELRNLKELKVLRIVVGAATEISKAEMNVLSSLQKLKVLDIDADKCRGIEALSRLDWLTLPQNLKELYLRNYHSKTMPDWFHPNRLPNLQYLYVENCDLEELTHDEISWKIEGLYLMSLMFELDWEHLKKSMPELRYMEISNCINFKNFPCAAHKPWRK